MPAEHTKNHRSKADSSELGRGIFLELACENGVHSHDHIAEHISDDRRSSKASEVFRHFTLSQLDIISSGL